MGFLSKFEGKMEDTFEGAADRVFDAPISPVQIAKKAEKKMRREKMVGAGKQYAPTLYTVLVNPDDDERLFGYYPTLAGETETYLAAKANDEGLVMDGQPLVRFIVDDGLKHGKFDVIAEPVAASIVEQLRAEEMARYGLISSQNYNRVVQSGGARAESSSRSRQARRQTYQDDYDQWQDPSDPYTPNDPYGFEPFDDGYDDLSDMAGFDDRGIGNPAAYRSSRQGGSKTASDGTPRTLTFDDGYQENLYDVPYLLDSATNRTYDLSASRMILGRETSCNIILSDINASRTHAELRLDNRGVWTLTDLGSTNGTYLNGRRIETATLRDGDRITIGVTNLEFCLS